jgi:hypothetical protein
MHGNPEQPERQRQQPDDGVQHERKERQRPAKDEQDAPQQKSSHRDPLCL